MNALLVDIQPVSSQPCIYFRLKLGQCLSCTLYIAVAHAYAQSSFLKEVCSRHAEQRQRLGLCSVALSNAAAFVQHMARHGSLPMLWYVQACCFVAHFCSTSIGKKFLASHVGPVYAIKSFVVCNIGL